jgi:hypothetical protein
MAISDYRLSRAGRGLSALATIAVLWTVTPITVIAQDNVEQDEIFDVEIATVWDRIAELRLRGEYEEAISLLDDVISRHADTEEILRHAYNHLVFTLVLMRDDVRVESAAREALLLFPDMNAPPPAFPDRMNDTYERLRRQMYGSLQITADPEESRIFLNGEYAGTTPLEIEYLGVGDYDLLISLPGYLDHESRLTIEPNQKLTQEISLDKHRGTGWWVLRVGAGAVIGTVIALVAGSGGQDAAQPLPGPPDPPAK